MMTSTKESWLTGALRCLFLSLPAPARPGKLAGPIAEFVLEIKPKPMPRPRVARTGHVFYPADYKVFERSLDSLLKDVLKEHTGVDGTFIVMIESVCAPLKTVVRAAPVGDVDNLAKAPLDRITKLGALWADDRAVMSLLTSKRFAEPGEPPHYHIVVHQL